MSGAGGRKRPAGQLSRGFPIDDGGSGRSVRHRPGNANEDTGRRPLPGSELYKMSRRVKIRSAPFKPGLVTWVTKPKGALSRKGGTGVACADQDAVHRKLWELYGYRWVEEVP